jgi:hypothetical protein
LRYYDGGAIFNNYNVFTIDGAVNAVHFNVSVPGFFVNHINGVIYKLNGVTNFSAAGLTFINYGTVHVTSGEWEINCNSTHYGTIRSFGTSIFHFDSGTVTFAGKSRFGGNSLVLLTGANILINATVTLDSATFELATGSFLGTDSILFNPYSTFKWNGGMIAGSVVVNIHPQATMIWAGTTKDFRGSAIINNYCHSSWTAGDLRYYDGGATFNNYNTFTVSGPVNLVQYNVPVGAGFINHLNAYLYINDLCTFSAANVLFSNYGLIGGIGTFQILCPFVHTGIINPGINAINNGVGILTLNGAQPLNANCSLNVQLFDGSGPGTGHDQLVRDGNCTLGGTLNVTLTGSVPDGTYTILHCLTGNVSGTFATVNLPPGCTLVINPTNCQIVKNTQNCTPNAGSWTTTACDSLVWNGITYTTSGQYIQVLTNNGGCDSTVTLNLTVNSSYAMAIAVTACDSYTWGRTVYTASGAYQNTYTAANGCDSVVTLNLIINNSNTGSFAATACNSYVWNNTTYTASGQYLDTLQNVAGCDSVVTLNLTINNSNTGTFAATECNSFVWNGTTYTTSGSYSQLFLSSKGCDSLATLNLVIHNSAATSFSETACSSYVWNNQTYSTSGNHMQTLQTVNGCDSVVTLMLTINTPVTWFLDADGDGHYTKDTSACSSPGTDWNSAGGTFGDCDDADNSIWQTGNLYVDADGDGYDAGTESVCYGASVPLGYAATTLGSDCDDNNANVWISTTWYKDGDNDGWYISQLSCNSPGSGWSNTISPTQLGDCNDNSNTIYPGATEICGNGIDEDCSGSDLPCGGGNCNATVTLTSGGLNALWVNAGASAQNTFYYGVTDALRMNTKITGGVGPFTYNWSNSGGTNFLLPRAYYPASSIDLFQPTAASTVTCTVTDQGTGCVYTVSLFMNWDNQFFCQRLKNTWYLNMCIDGQNVCLPWTASRTALQNNTGTMGNCAPAKATEPQLLSLYLEVFPNPNNGAFMLSVANAQNGSTLEVLDPTGKRLHHEVIQTTEGQYASTFDWRDKPAGVYFVQVISNHEVATQKVVIRH